MSSPCGLRVHRDKHRHKIMATMDVPTNETSENWKCTRISTHNLIALTYSRTSEHASTVTAQPKRLRSSKNHRFSYWSIGNQSRWISRETGRCVRSLGSFENRFPAALAIPVVASSAGKLVEQRGVEQERRKRIEKKKDREQLADQHAAYQQRERASNQQPSIIASATLEFLNVIFLFCLHSLYDRNFCPLPPLLP